MFVNWPTLWSIICDLEIASQAFSANCVCMVFFMSRLLFCLQEIALLFLKKLFVFFSRLTMQFSYLPRVSVRVTWRVCLMVLLDIQKNQEVARGVSEGISFVPALKGGCCMHIYTANTVVDLVLNESSERFLFLSRFQFHRKTCWPPWHYLLGLLSFVETWGLNLV